MGFDSEIKADGRQNSEGYWYRAHGNENWEFDSNGLATKRFACINDMPINEMERRFF